MELNSYPSLLQEELSHIYQLIYKAKFNEALNFFEYLEQKGEKKSKDELSCLILKGRIYCYMGKYKLAFNIGELGYQLSQKLGHTLESIEALVIKAHTVYLWNTDEAFNCVIKAEKLINSIKDVIGSDISRQQAEIFLIKSLICHYKGDLNEAMDLAKQCL